MRITGGKARGITLHAPSRGDIRPATDYLREAVFASLGAVVEDARVLDCFAGTGAYALEAMSRGAAHATLVEQNAATLKSTRRNADAVAKSAGFSADAAIVIRQGDAVQWVKRQAQALGGGAVATDATGKADSIGQSADDTAIGHAVEIAPEHSVGNSIEKSASTGGYTLIFADPPYPVWEGEPAALLAALAALLDHSSSGSRLVLEAPGDWSPPELPGLELLRHLKKGPRQPSALIYRPAR